ncbi:hypothetical protein [Amycolatopsis sp. NPDC059657]|uniref:hypothetical protein n=1 Tax=Amycolatopsis sp. NPDC059657 TaxID=3346899 RepID=UPI0036721746
MLTNVLTVAASALAGLAMSAFGFLKYRAYTRTVRHIVDKLGVDGLKSVDAIVPPSNLARPAPAKTDAGPLAPTADPPAREGRGSDGGDALR